MSMKINQQLLEQIHQHGEAAYPEEGAGLMLGHVNGNDKQVTFILGMKNAFAPESRHHRYLLTPRDYAQIEEEATRLGLDILGIFHSHPDHPDQPSEFDREWAMPWLSYLITTVKQGHAAGSRSWVLAEDHTCFIEEKIDISEQE